MYRITSLLPFPWLIVHLRNLMRIAISMDGLFSIIRRNLLVKEVGCWLKSIDCCLNRRFCCSWVSSIRSFYCCFFHLHLLFKFTLAASFWISGTGNILNLLEYLNSANELYKDLTPRRLGGGRVTIVTTLQRLPRPKVPIFGPKVPRTLLGGGCFVFYHGCWWWL